MCGQKFELKIDNVRFVGHPTLLQHALGQVWSSWVGRPGSLWVWGLETGCAGSGKGMCSELCLHTSSGSSRERDLSPCRMHWPLPPYFQDVSVAGVQSRAKQCVSYPGLTFSSVAGTSVLRYLYTYTRSQTHTHWHCIEPLFRSLSKCI